VGKISKAGHRDNVKGIDLDGVLDAALEIARRRRDTLAGLRAALETGNQEQAIKLAKALCGLADEQESHRTDSRVN
jgi:hypothetical protein